MTSEENMARTSYVVKVCCESFFYESCVVEEYLQDRAHCQVGGWFEYCSGGNTNNTTLVVSLNIAIYIKPGYTFEQDSLEIQKLK